MTDQITFTPRNLQKGMMQVYCVFSSDETSPVFLYLINHASKSHTLVWNGSIELDDLIRWDNRLVDLTRPASEKKTVDGDNTHYHHCHGEFSVDDHGKKKDVSMDFDNEEHRVIHERLHGFFLRGSITHDPFDICGMHTCYEISPTVDLGMHNYAPFPKDIFELYTETRIHPFSPTEKQCEEILQQTNRLWRYA